MTETIDQQPTPAEEPPLKRLWANMGAKNKDFTVPYDEFEKDMQDENNVRSLHANLPKFFDGFAVPYDEFTADMGLAKKKVLLDSGNAAGTGSLAEKPFVEVAPDAPKLTGEAGAIDTVSANPGLRLAPGDEYFGTGAAMPSGKQLRQQTEDAAMAKFAAMPGTTNPDVREVVDKNALGEMPQPLAYGMERVVVPKDHDTQVPANTVTDAKSGLRYFDRPLSRKVDGKEQTVYESAKALLHNSMIGMAQGIGEGAAALGNSINSTPLGKLNPYGDAYDASMDKTGALLDTKMRKVSDLASRQPISIDHPETWVYKSAEYAPMVIAQVAQTLAGASEAKIGVALAKTIGLASTIAFDAPFFEGAAKDADRAGLSGENKARYIILQGSLVLGGFKGGSKLMGALGDKLAMKLAPDAARNAIALDATQSLAALEARMGRAATANETRAALSTSLQKVMPGVLNIPKQVAQQSSVFAGAEAVKIAANQVLAPALGGTADKITPMQALEQVGGAAIAGATTGLITGVGEGLLGAIPSRGAKAGEPVAAAEQPSMEAPVEQSIPAVAPPKPSYEMPDSEAEAYAGKWHSNIPLGIEHEGKAVFADVTLDGKFYELHDGTGSDDIIDDPALHKQVMELLPAKLAELQAQAASAEPVAPEMQPEAVTENTAVAGTPEPDLTSGTPEQVQPLDIMGLNGLAGQLAPEQGQPATDVTGQAPEAIPAEAAAEPAQFTPNEPLAASEQPPVGPPTEPPVAEPLREGPLPDGSKERAHTTRATEDAKAQMTDDEKNYVPTHQIRDASEKPADYIKRVGPEAAYQAAMDPQHTTNDVLQQDVIGEVKLHYAIERDAALARGDQAAADVAQNRVMRLNGRYGEIGTKLGQGLAARVGAANTISDLSDAVDPKAAVAATTTKALGDVQRVNDEVEKEADQTAAEITPKAKSKRKAKMAEVVESPAVSEAIAAAVEQNGQTPAKLPQNSRKSTQAATPDAPAWGSTNKLFSKEKIAAAKAALRKMGPLSTGIPPDLIHLVGFHVEAGARSFAEMSKRVLRDAGQKVKPLLAEAYEQVKRQLVAKGDTGKGFDGPDSAEALMKKEQAEAVADNAVTAAEKRTAAPSQPGTVDPFRELVDTLKKKVNEKLSKLTPGQKKPAREAIAHALQNRAEYAEVFEAAKKEAEAKIDALQTTDAKKAKMTAELQGFYNEIIGKPFADRQFEQAFKEAKAAVFPNATERAKNLRDSALNDSDRAAVRSAIIDHVTAELRPGTPEHTALADYTGRVYDHEVAQHQAAETERRSRALPTRVKRLVDDAVALANDQTQDAHRTQLEKDVATGLDPNHAATGDLVKDALNAFDQRVLDKQQSVRNKAGVYDANQAPPVRTPPVRPTVPERITHLYNARATNEQVAERVAPDAVREGLKGLGKTIKDVISQHADDIDADRRTLTDKLIQDAGLTGSAAKAVSDAVEKEWNKRRESAAWQKLRGRFQPKKTQAASKALDRLVNDLNVAANLPDSTMRSPVAQVVEQFLGGQITVSAEDAANIERLSQAYVKAATRKAAQIGNKIVEVRNTRATVEASIDLLKALGKLKNADQHEWTRDVGAMFYASILSNPNTHLANLYLNALSTGHEVGLISTLHTLGSTGSLGAAMQPFMGLFRGLTGRGIADAAYVATTGIDVNTKTGSSLTAKDFESDPLEEHSVIRARAIRALNKLGIGQGWAIPEQSILRGVRRSLGAQDTFAQGGLAEARATEIATKMAYKAARIAKANNKAMSSGEFQKMVGDEADRILFRTKEAMADINAIVDSEGLGSPKTPMEWAARQSRIGDLLDQARTSEHPELVADAKLFAARHAGNSDYEGHFGILAENIGKAFSGLPIVGKFAVPFAKVTSNFQNRYAEWTGLGFYRAYKGGAGKPVFGGKGIDERYQREYSPEERQKAALRSTIGVGLALTAAGMVRAGMIAIHGLGTGDKDKDRRARPQTIEFLKHPGVPDFLVGTSINFKGYNAEMALTAVGQVEQWRKKRNLAEDDPTYVEMFGMATMFAGAAAMNAGPTNGAGDFLGSISQVDTNSGRLATVFKNMATNGIKSAVQPGGIQYVFEKLNQATDTNLPEKRNAAFLAELRLKVFGDVPYWMGGQDLSGAKEALDGFGESMAYDSHRFFSFAPVANDPDHERLKQFLVDRDLMPTEMKPNNPHLRLLDPTAPVGERQATPLDPTEYHDFVQARGKGFYRRLTDNNEQYVTLIRDATTAKQAASLRDNILKIATDDALKAALDARIAKGMNVVFKLDPLQKMQQELDAQKALNEKLAEKDN